MGQDDTGRNGEGTGGDVVPPHGKTPYAPPVLIEWGTLRDITRTAGWTGASDSGGNPQGRKTRP